MDTSSLPLSLVSQRFVSIVEGSSGVLRKDSFAKVKKFLQRCNIFLRVNRATSTMRNNKNNNKNNNTALENTWIPARFLAEQPSLLAQGNYLLVLGNDLVGGWLAGSLPIGQVDFKSVPNRKFIFFYVVRLFGRLGIRL